MRSKDVGGGGVTYFKLGVGWCSYDASTVSWQSATEQSPAERVSLRVMNRIE